MSDCDSIQLSGGKILAVYSDFLPCIQHMVLQPVSGSFPTGNLKTYFRLPLSLCPHNFVLFFFNITQYDLIVSNVVKVKP